MDKLVVSAYEDKVRGVMPEALCVQLMNRYEDERWSKLEQRTQFTAQLEATQQDEHDTDDKSDFDSFSAIICKYMGTKELTPVTINGFVKKT